jgi:tetratricopeptide (TPR) repeat protein
MTMVNPAIMLRRADTAFADGRYDEAMRHYALLLDDFPNLIEARVGVFLCDFAAEYEAEAAALFDYYHTIKERSDAEAVIRTLAESLEAIHRDLHMAARASTEEAVELSDGIRYGDFLQAAQTRDDFKTAFEDMLFSTKVVITSKEEFIDFVTRLVDAGLRETALKYLDASGALFENDQDVLALYDRVEGNER